MWLYVIAAFVLLILLKKLIRIPTVGRYGDRYVFITGCDSGFGKLLALRLDGLGFNVFAACYSGKGEEELLKIASDKLKTVSLDVTKTESIEKARNIVETTLPSGKGIWAIVNNAGIAGTIAPTEWLTRSDYEQCLAVNLYGVIDVARVFQPLVRRAKGRVVNISSMMGRIAAATGPYAVSKYGVEAFTDVLRREVRKQGISVHLLEPGFFKTDIVDTNAITRSLQRSFDRTTDEIKKYYGVSFVNAVKKTANDMIGLLASSKTHLVVDAYTHAITAVFPRTRYLVGNDCKYFFRPLWNLPEWITDAVLSIGTPKPDGEK